MNTDLLSTFLEVAKTRHFGQAAGNLFLTQSAISARIKQLEAIIGSQVFTRERNNILLTAAGERLLPHAEGLLASWKLAIQEMGMPHKENSQLTLGGTSNLWDTFLQSLLPRLAAEFPALYMRTEINNTQHLVRSLFASRVDVFATLDPPYNVDFEVESIGELELIMVCNKNCVELGDVQNKGFVFVDWGTAFNLKQASMFATPVPPVLHTAQSRIALEYILTYQGAAYLPRALVQNYIDKSCLFQVSGSLEEKQQVYAVYLKDSENKTLEQAIRFLKNEDIKPDRVLRLI